MKRPSLAFAAAAVACLVAMPEALCADPQKKPPGQPDKMTAEQWSVTIGSCIRTVQKSDNPDVVVEAYRQGCKIDADNVQLHEEYMRRMLKLGVPHVAAEPAEALRRLQPKNVLALGTLGCVYAQRGRFPEALQATVAAAMLCLDDESIVRNVGQLIAWYQHDPKAKSRIYFPIEPQIEQLLAKLKPRPRRHPYSTYRAGYALGVRALREKADAIAQYDRDIRRLEKEIGYAEKRAGKRATVKRDRLVQTQSVGQKLEDLKRQLAQVERELAGLPGSQNVSDPRYRDDLRRRRSRLTARAAALRKAIEKQAKSTRAVGARAIAATKDSTAAHDTLTGQRLALQELRKQREEALASPGGSWQWAPPAVDGKVWPVVGALPGSKHVPAEGADREAERLYKLARMYFGNRMYDKAAGQLERILKLYGSTDAARKARELLARLPRKPSAGP